MQGGDLRFHISRKTFTEDAVRFWMAELACALRHIHKQGIVHRDIKPDNVLLDEGGHVHLADFNVASDFSPNRPLTSKSGTLAYLAPEVYIGRGYLSEVDWWSLGVTFYECIYNKRPFESNTHDGLAQAIVKATPPFPVTSPPVSMSCNHAISSLLEKDKTKRIGAMSFESFTDNPFFREIDFIALERREVDPVFHPSTEKTNFDATYDLEELLLEEAPLEARARKQKPRAELRDDATQQEKRTEELHRMIEQYFEPFNYELLPTARTPAEPGSESPTAGETSSPSRQRGDTTPRPSREPPRSIPTPRSNTPATTSRTRSSTHSPEGSPPLAVAELAAEPMPGIARSGSQKQTPTQKNPFPPPPMPNQQQPPTSEPRPSEPRRSTAPRQQSQPRLPRSGNNNKVHYNDTGSLPSNHSGSRHHRPRGAARSTSMGGGVQVVLSEQGSWSEMANQSQGMIGPANDEGGMVGRGKATGVLGFLSRKKGRERSPKGDGKKQRERGVLGKEGARVVVSPG